MTALPLDPDYELKKVDSIKHMEGDIDPAKDQALPTVSAYAEWSKVAVVRRFWKSSMFATFAAFAAIFDGYAVTIPGSIVANPGFVAVFGTIQTATGLALDPNHVGAWTGVQSAGQIVGMWSGPFLSDRFGRKMVMYAVLVALLLGIILEIVAKNWGVYIAARLFAGIGTGFVQSGITVYISEIAPAQIRGSLLSMYSFFFALGQLAAAIALKIVGDMAPGKFRHGFYSEFVFVGLFIPMIAILPESPWYYTRRHDADSAKKSMLRLYGNVEHYDVEHEFKVLEENVAAFEALHNVQSKASWFEIFKGSNGRRTFISYFPLVFQQFLGIPLVFGYSTYFFSLSGLTDPFLSSMIINIILLCFIIVSFWTVELVGRRPSLLIGGVIMGLCTFFMGILGILKGNLNGTALVSLCAVWVAAYALSAGPLGWTFLGESSTPRLRAKTAGFAAGGTACTGLIFNYTVPIMLADPGANWGVKIGFFWAGLTALALIIIFFTIPETKGRTYEELDELFTRKISARRFPQTKTAVQAAEEAQHVA